MLFFKKVDPMQDHEIDLMVKWENDPQIGMYLRPNFDNRPLEPLTHEKLKSSFADPSKLCYLFSEEQSPQRYLGYVQLQFAHPVMLGEKKHGAWLAICIGEEDARGKGYGKEAMRFIEKTAKGYGVTRMELGVFEFNHRAIALYQSMGYRPFALEENFAWYEGKQFCDIRMEKYL